MLEQDPITRRQPIMEGLEISARMHRVVDGVVEFFDVMVSQIRKNPDGEGHTGIVDAVDQFGMAYDQEVVSLPDEVDLTEGKVLVIDELPEGEQQEEAKRRIISPKIAAIIGGATLVGAAATVYWRIKD